MMSEKYSDTQKLLCQAGILAGDSTKDLSSYYGVRKYSLDKWRREIAQKSDECQREIYKKAFYALHTRQKYAASIANGISMENILLRIKQDTKNIQRREEIIAEISLLDTEYDYDKERADALSKELKVLHIIPDSSLSAYLRSLQKQMKTGAK